MAKLIAILLVVVTLSGVGWWLWQQTNHEAVGNVGMEVETNQVTESESGAIVREPSNSDRQVYFNQKWRFSFEYPKYGWKVREPAFGSATTLFNLAIWPDEENIFDPVSINLTPKWWIDRLLDKKEGDIEVAGLPGWYYQSTTMSVIPQMSYFILINDEYWINISIQNEYLEDFQMVLDTFQLHEPLPTLEEFGIDPLNPSGT